MTGQHNISIVQRIGAAIRAASLADAAGDFDSNVVWHYFNPQLPALDGDYVGIAGIKEFFDRVEAATSETFRVEPVSARAVGRELVVTHGRLALVVDRRAIETDVVVVWRIVNGLVVEVWDIPAAYTAEPRRTPQAEHISQT